MTQYEAAKKRYAERGVDADAAINTLKSVPVSLCTAGRATMCAALTATRMLR